AEAIDARLTDAQHRTLLHGDAKLANFCFSADDPVRVAAVDFQYAGGGCGMKDVAYLLSCLSNTRLERHAEDYVDTYFSALRKRLGPELGASIETEWRALYPFAVADFERFLAGWAPSHAKRGSYAQRLTLTILQAL
ncbi:MAG: phosphotransferase, partial [Myxococcota bacterium]